MLKSKKWNGESGEVHSTFYFYFRSYRRAPGLVRQSKRSGVYAEGPRGPLGAEASPDPPRVTIRHLAPWLSL